MFVLIETNSLQLLFRTHETHQHRKMINKMLSLKSQLAVESHRAELSTSSTCCLCELVYLEKLAFHLLLALSLALIVYAAIEPQIKGGDNAFVVKLMDYNLMY